MLKHICCGMDVIYVATSKQDVRCPCIREIIRMCVIVYNHKAHLEKLGPKK